MAMTNAEKQRRYRLQKRQVANGVVPAVKNQMSIREQIDTLRRQLDTLITRHNTLANTIDPNGDAFTIAIVDDYDSEDKYSYGDEDAADLEDTSEDTSEDEEPGEDDEITLRSAEEHDAERNVSVAFVSIRDMVPGSPEILERGLRMGQLAQLDSALRSTVFQANVELAREWEDWVEAGGFDDAAHS